MNITIPARDLRIVDKQKYIKLCKRTIIRVAERYLGRKEVTIRDILPSDVGLKNWAVTNADWINNQSLTNRILMIYKVLQLGNNPTSSILKIYNGGMMVGIHNLELSYGGLPILRNLEMVLRDPIVRAVLNRMTTKDEIGVNPALGAPMEAYFSEPYLFMAQDWLRINIEPVGPDDYLVLGGLVAEPPGMTVV